MDVFGCTIGKFPIKYLVVALRYDKLRREDQQHPVNKIVSWMKKEFEDLIDLLVSFSFVFVIDVIVYSLLV